MSAQPGRAVQAGRFFTLLVTNAIKTGGLYVAIRTVTTPTPSAIEVGLAAFMMAGAQISEDTILRLVGRMFGAEHRHEGPPK